MTRQEFRKLIVDAKSIPGRSYSYALDSANHWRKELAIRKLASFGWIYKEPEKLPPGYMSQVLKDLYDTYFLDPRDAAKYRMIGKYEDRISQRLIIERARLKKKGQEESKRMWKQFAGSYPAQPIGEVTLVGDYEIVTINNLKIDDK